MHLLRYLMAPPFVQPYKPVPLITAKTSMGVNNMSFYSNKIWHIKISKLLLAVKHQLMKNYSFILLSDGKNGDQ
jgi:hypothetical protein